jgi:hypothetical protein
MEFDSRARAYLELPLRRLQTDSVGLQFHLNLTAYNPNRYPV